ncbi:MAG: hypothetical protein DME24_19145 [Verrucomicrobia bacterium]|nr:MAG: hypothetical protein DME24_19145 [Verrucomicrobiota bacterium]
METGDSFDWQIYHPGDWISPKKLPPRAIRPCSSRRREEAELKLAHENPPPTPKMGLEETLALTPAPLPLN